MSVVLITGANKGLGHATARLLLDRGHTVYLGARDQERGRAAADELGGRFVQLDVTDTWSVADAMRAIGEEAGHLDILINNAGIVGGIPDVEQIDPDIALQTFDTNVVGIIRVTQAALPLLRQSANPVVVNVSSALGSFWALTNPERRQYQRPFVVYGSSKAAVSMLTLQYAMALPDIKVNAVEPGFTATDFTAGVEGGQDPADGAEVIAGVATIGPDGPTGTFIEQEGPLPW